VRAESKQGRLRLLFANVRMELLGRQTWMVSGRWSGAPLAPVKKKDLEQKERS